MKLRFCKILSKLYHCCRNSTTIHKIFHGPTEPKKWLSGWLLFAAIPLAVIGIFVYMIDPYFHYHKPNTEKYYYTLDNERSMNNGISRNFEYDALITGSSAAQNFKTSEMDEIFGVNAVKVPFPGGSYKEINNNVSAALEDNENLRIVVRSLDMDCFFEPASVTKEDLGLYPTYLYDGNPFSDVKYLFNKDVIFDKAYSMYIAHNEGDFPPGITSFDIYSNWQQDFNFGIKSVCPDGIEYAGLGGPVHLQEDEKNIILENITQNVTSLADQYPDVDFYYYFTPYSIEFYRTLAAGGTIYRYSEAEQYIIELILAHQNIHLYFFNNRTDITTDLNNYKDMYHYGEWINSQILRWMYNGDYLLTRDNYLDFLMEELTFYTTFDYNSLNNQSDYECDLLAAALMKQDLTGIPPTNLLELDESDLHLSNASLVMDTGDGSVMLQCTGSLQRKITSKQSVSSYMISKDYVGAKLEIDDIGDYQYLMFYGRKVTDQGGPAVYVYNGRGIIVAQFSEVYSAIDNEWHQYGLDLSGSNGRVTIIFNGGYSDDSGSPDSRYLFKDIMLY